MKTIIIRIGTHFKEQFNSRFKEQSNLIDYLNKTLPEGILSHDPQYRGVYFPNAGMYVPIVNSETSIGDWFAKTIQYKAFSAINSWKFKPRRVIWKEVSE